MNEISLHEYTSKEEKDRIKGGMDALSVFLNAWIIFSAVWKDWLSWVYLNKIQLFEIEKKHFYILLEPTIYVYFTFLCWCGLAL